MAPPTKRNTSSRSASLERWRSVLLYGIAGAGITLLSYRVIFGPISDAVRPLGWFAPCTLFLVALALYLMLHRPSRAMILGVRHPVAYPPLWYGAIVGVICLLAAAGNSVTVATHLGWRGPHRHEFMISCAALVFLSFVLSVLGVLLSRRTSPQSASTGRVLVPAHTDGAHAAAPLLATDHAQLLAWLADDREVDDPALDAFGHNKVALRIVESILAPPRSANDSDTAMVLGKRGSGKTTIQRLVVRELTRRSVIGTHMEFVPISLWPYETPEAAVRAVLDRLVQAASAHIDTLGLRALPTEYVEVIETIDGPLRRILTPLRRRASPEDLLDRLATALDAVGVEVVLWIEDLERFSRTGGDDADRLAPIRSLVFQLDRIACIHVVLASATLVDGFDLDKIVRTVEQPPTLPAHLAWPIIASFRAHCLAGRGNEILDFADRTPGSGMEPPPPGVPISMWLVTLFPDRPSPHRALADLLDTPRVLKVALRECLRRWTELKGEIDFDDLLAISAIRATRESDVFAFIAEHVAALREQVDTSTETGKRRGEWTLPRRDELASLIDKSDSARERAALRSLVAFVFPHWTGDVYPGTVHYKPQGMSLGIYWDRYISLTISDENPADQPTMRSIEAWRANRAGDLTDLLMDYGRALHVQHFGFRFTGSELTELLGACVDHLLRRDYKTWGDRHPPAFVILARLFSNANIDSGLIESRLEQDLLRAARTNLPLMSALLIWFTGDRTRAGPPFTDAQRSSLRRSAREALVEYLGVANPSEIVAVLRGGPSHTLYVLCQSLRDPGSDGEPNSPFQGWDVVARSLMTAALEQPNEVLDQIIHFVVAERTRTGFGMLRDPDGEIPVLGQLSFDAAKARALFPIAELERAFSGARPEAPWDAETRRMFDVVRQGVRSVSDRAASP